MLKITLIKTGLDYYDAGDLWKDGPVVCCGYIRRYFRYLLGNATTPDRVILLLHYRPFRGSNTAILTGPHLSVYHSDGSMCHYSYCYGGLRYYILKEMGIEDILDPKSHHVFFKMEDVS